MAIDWAPFKQLVAEGERFVLTSHLRPDSDALGSELGLAAVLKALGKEAIILNADPVPPALRFLDPQNHIRSLRDESRVPLLETFDTFIVVDTSAWVQLGGMGDHLREFAGQKIVIDHHASSDDLSAVEFKDVKAEATGRLIVEAADALGVSLTKEMAVPLFAAIATDTGWFRFSSVNANTYAVVARLVEAGAQPSDIHGNLYEQGSLSQLRLRGRVLARAKLFAEDTCGYLEVTQADFTATETDPRDTENLINALLNIAGVQCAIIFVEMDPNTTKVSLRGKKGFDVRRVAEEFGGGGHVQAAGVMMRQPLATARPTILDAISRLVE